jgi:hypothetical protein
LRRRLPVESWILNEPDELVSLAADVRPPARIFTVVLDALLSDGRPKLDLDKLNRVGSQLGWQISQLDKLPADVQATHRAEL